MMASGLELRICVVDGSRYLVIGLDAYERKVADELIAEGRLPNFARLASSSACFDLEQELPARHTGETWHQISTGLHPSQSGRWSPVWFDPRAFQVTQPDAVDAPFTVGLSAKTVVFDVPHFNIARDPSARGVVNWGCHHPGVPRATRPPELWSEIEQRFGTYPAGEHIYGLVWDDAEDTERMAANWSRRSKTGGASAPGF